MRTLAKTNILTMYKKIFSWLRKNKLQFIKTLNPFLSNRTTCFAHLNTILMPLNLSL